MASKQIRLNTQSIIREKLPEISGKYANIVMQSGEVFFIKISGADNDFLEGSDMRLSQIKLHLADITEIILDIPA
ncbi:MAG: hypothetical protein AAF843_16855 [Bacteroidota bacterium]